MFHFPRIHFGRKVLWCLMAVIVLILLIVCICCIVRSFRSTSQADEVAKNIVVRAHIYRPDIEKLRHFSPTLDQLYSQNGPAGTTILVHHPKEIESQENRTGYFAISVDTKKSKKLCQEIVTHDLIKPAFITINDDTEGICPGIIKFYFKYQNHKPLVESSQSESGKGTEFAEQEPTVQPECTTASQCDVAEDCVQNNCTLCPLHSSRIVRLGKRLGQTHCYCQGNYQPDKKGKSCQLEKQQIFEKAESKKLEQVEKSVQAPVQKVYRQVVKTVQKPQSEPVQYVYVYQGTPQETDLQWMDNSMKQINAQMQQMEQWVNQFNPFVFPRDNFFDFPKLPPMYIY